MKIYKQQTVVEAARARIRYLFQEFPNVVVGFSGGKDSTVCFHLTREIAEELGRLPVKVLWIDQEAEWQGTVDICTQILTREDVTPYWFQMPMVITNNANSTERYAYCWRPEDAGQWIYPKHPVSIKENTYGTDRFHKLFRAIFAKEFPSEKTCYISGVRTQENPKRYVGLTHAPTYKWVTWGKILDKRRQHFSFYPIYDWEHSDVWKYIFEQQIPYNTVYDAYYRFGMPLQEMRISNLHHETAIQSLTFVQEIEPETWARVAARIYGANTIKHLQKNAFTCPKQYPPMFHSWEDYGYYLAEHLIPEEQYKQQLYRQIAKKKALYNGEKIRPKFWKIIINTILSADWDFTKLCNFERRPATHIYRKWKKGQDVGPVPKPQYLTYFTDRERADLMEHLHGR